MNNDYKTDENNSFDVVLKSHKYFFELLSNLSFFTETVYLYFHENELNMIVFDNDSSHRIIFGLENFFNYNCKNNWVKLKIKPLLRCVPINSDFPVRFYMRNNFKFIFVVECIENLNPYAFHFPSEVITMNSMDYILFKLNDIKPHYVNNQDVNDLSDILEMWSL